MAAVERAGGAPRDRRAVRDHVLRVPGAAHGPFGAVPLRALALEPARVPVVGRARPAVDARRVHPAVLQRSRHLQGPRRIFCTRFLPEYSSFWSWSLTGLETCSSKTKNNPVRQT